jgi:hypothetical protein
VLTWTTGNYTDTYPPPLRLRHARTQAIVSINGSAAAPTDTALGRYALLGYGASERLGSFTGATAAGLRSDVLRWVWVWGAALQDRRMIEAIT